VEREILRIVTDIGTSTSAVPGGHVPFLVPRYFAALAEFRLCARHYWLRKWDRSRTERLLPMRVVVPWDRVALGSELPVLPEKLKTIS
jgi:hypothetical protein